MDAFLGYVWELLDLAGHVLRRAVLALLLPVMDRASPTGVSLEIRVGGVHVWRGEGSPAEQIRAGVGMLKELESSPEGVEARLTFPTVGADLVAGRLSRLAGSAYCVQAEGRTLGVRPRR